MRACLVLETVTGVLYCFKFNNFTKLLNFTNWYKSFPTQIGSKLRKRIDKFKEEQILETKYTNNTPIVSTGKYRYLSMERKKDHNIIHNVMQSGYIENSLPFEYRDNPDFMLEYIRRNVAAFLICSKRLKFDPSFVERANEIDFCMAYINDSRNWNNTMRFKYGKVVNIVDDFLVKYVEGRQIVQVNNNYNKKENESPPPINGNPLIANHKPAMVRVKENGLYLKYCTEELTSNRDIVFTAVQNNGMALSFAHVKFREDVEIVREALFNNPYSIRLISTSFLDNNEEIILNFMARNLCNFEYLIPSKYTSNFDLMRKAIILNPHNYSRTYPPSITLSLNNEKIKTLRHDKELIIPYIWFNPNKIPALMRKLPIECIDRDVVLAVILAPNNFNCLDKSSDFILRRKMKYKEILDIKYKFSTNILINSISISTMKSTSINQV
ncbi:predicted protein [Naegleria gruberi]|uniref:Predicted protein n=1 Tax=Naegleria gruberi TaxID=5762 RepID=D2W321_NAEGR|nr:uncharacterized protein NAEGRDRAFT_75791 [Naegleria gruberi]EFC36506.1 predicted protein [Naegleria gruberi]|eukprot:XP_002669250.1 predicted protein [Naegleria gruberi strain NEG-M]